MNNFRKTFNLKWFTQSSEYASGGSALQFDSKISYGGDLLWK